jgi:hypothetical protein
MNPCAQREGGKRVEECFGDALTRNERRKLVLTSCSFHVHVGTLLAGAHSGSTNVPSNGIDKTFVRRDLHIASW